MQRMMILLASVLPAPDSPANKEFLIQLSEASDDKDDDDDDVLPDITMQVSLPFLLIDLYAASAMAKICGGLSNISRPTIKIIHKL